MLHKAGVIAFATLLLPLTSMATGGGNSVARTWNEEILSAIRIDVPHPPVHARNLFHLAAGMYDAWAAYDDTAIGYYHHERQTAVDVPAARREAISYAAFRILRQRYALSANADITLPALDSTMQTLGYDTNITTTVGDNPPALGNRIAESLLTWALDDRSGETNLFVDPTYTNTQPAFLVISNGVPLGGFPNGADPDTWHPLTFDSGFAQNGVGPIFLQPFIGGTWIDARSFALERREGSTLWYDPGPPHQLRGTNSANYKAEAIALIQKSKQLGEAALIDISPASIGNNPLGTDAGTGYVTNPVTGTAYAPTRVPLGDYTRVISEFWADGPDSETPPGHWHVLANEVTDITTNKLIGAQGPPIDDLEWDIKLYFALAASTHDAACAAWSLKRYYDSPRPISMIRFMANKGQSSDPALPSYDPEGLPLSTGLVSVVTSNSLDAGGEHHGLGFTEGEILVFAWPGRPLDPTQDRSIPRWIRGVDWFPYQQRTFVSPAFPGYISGHSTFSRAAAEVMTRFTGSAYFPGGMGTHRLEPGSLAFEFGPSVPVELQWATYYDAADEAGISRRWGGIHPALDDLPGRIIGSDCGIRAWEKAKSYWEGSVVSNRFKIAIEDFQPIRISWNTLPGFDYRVNLSSNLTGGGVTSTHLNSVQENETMWETVLPPHPTTFISVESLGP